MSPGLVAELSVEQSGNWKGPLQLALELDCEYYVIWQFYFGSCMQSGLKVFCLLFIWVITTLVWFRKYFKRLEDLIVIIA